MSNMISISRYTLFIALSLSLVFIGAQAINGGTVSATSHTAVDQARAGLDDGGPGGGEAELSVIIRNVIGILSMGVGIVSVVMIIVGGFKYIVSQRLPESR